MHQKVCKAFMLDAALRRKDTRVSDGNIAGQLFQKRELRSLLLQLLSIASHPVRPFRPRLGIRNERSSTQAVANLDRAVATPSPEPPRLATNVTFRSP